MILHGYPASPNTWKIRAVAHHIGVPLEVRLVDLAKGEQKQPAFLALNPTGRTPALVDGDFVLWESTAILQYVAAQKPNDLWPDHVRTRADIVRWQSWQLQHWAAACEPMLLERLVKSYFNLGPPDEAVLARAGRVFETEGAMLDDHLARHAYLVEDRLTLADFSVAAYLFYAKEGGLPVAPFVNIGRWFREVAAVPAWHATAPTMVGP